MNNREQVVGVFVDVIANMLSKPKEEIASNLDAKLKEDFHMDSVGLYALIGMIEGKFDFDLDYAKFLENSTTINNGIDLVTEILSVK